MFCRIRLERYAQRSQTQGVQIARSRGVCRTCATLQARLVRTGKLTEGELLAKGWKLPPVVNRWGR